MSNDEANDLLHKVIKFNKSLVEGSKDPVATMLNWMYCYGGDSTFLLISHYGDGLEAAIREATRYPRGGC